MVKQKLNKGWMVKYETLETGPDMAMFLQNSKEGWMVADLPCDVHIPLIQNGIIRDPVEADYSYESEWIEEKSWWFKKTFMADESLMECDVVELTLEFLDSEADIFFNGVHLAHHRSAFYPFTADVKRFLQKGENILLVRLTSGLEYVSEKDLAGISKSIITEKDRGRGDRGDRRRVFVRKPQFVYGWDWGPRVATCGIMGNVWIQGYKKIAIRMAHAITETVGTEEAVIRVETEIENFHTYMSMEGMVEVEILEGNKVVWSQKAEHLFKSGINYFTFKAVVKSPRLWWPNGMGEQFLYTVIVKASVEGANAEYLEFKTGVRVLKLNMERVNDKERLFRFEVNGKEIFCKGANWVPADSIYARVTDEKYEALIREARDANFNMLRIWGGGRYEKDIFYELCDQMGIMIWHDFMFCCAVYPDNLEWFRQEAEKEMDYQTRRLRNHPSIVLWCGNNENAHGFATWWLDSQKPSFDGGAFCSNNIAPKVVHRNCPEIPYWNSSQYGGDYPNSNEVGDRHHWADCMMNSIMDKRITPEEYDLVTAKFISEFGYPGPCVKSSIIKYHGSEPVEIGSRVWQLHCNTLERGTVVEGIRKHYTDPEHLNLDGYIFYASLCQGLMLGYALEAIRFKLNCGGSLFWMYNDCWGEIGWSIVDYYLKRKPSYYFVKRAFAPLKLIMRREGSLVRVLGANDTLGTVQLELEYGFVSYDGKHKDCKHATVVLKPNSRSIVIEFVGNNDRAADGLYYVKPLMCDNKVLPAVLREKPFRQIQIPSAKLTVTDFQNNHRTMKFTISSDKFAHAVHFNMQDKAVFSDEYFDMLPGESREIVICNSKSGFNIDELEVRSLV